MICYQNMAIYANNTYANMIMRKQTQTKNRIDCI